MSLDDVVNRLKFNHHFLMVAVALSRRPAANGVAHSDVYLGTFLLLFA
jgi:hypothetical protein